MNNTDMWSLIVGFFLPLAISVIQQSHWSDGLRAVVGFVACVIASIGTVLIQLDTWDWHRWIQSVLLILITAISTYKGFWQKTGIAPALESSTSPPRRP